MATSKKPGISFTLSKEQQAAFETIAGGNTVRLAGRIVGDKVTIDFVACNSPFRPGFTACNTSFSACNTAFTACNSSFAACNTSFAKPAGRAKTKAKSPK
jgi:hypothetical protein